MTKDNSNRRDYNEDKSTKKFYEEREQRKRTKHKRPIEDWLNVDDEIEIEIEMDYEHFI